MVAHRDPHRLNRLRNLPLAPEVQARFEAMAAQSVKDQKQIEANDSLPFEIYRQQYVSAERLGLNRREAVAH